MVQLYHILPLALGVAVGIAKPEASDGSYVDAARQAIYDTFAPLAERDVVSRDEQLVHLRRSLQLARSAVARENMVEVSESGLEDVLKEIKELEAKVEDMLGDQTDDTADSADASAGDDEDEESDDCSDEDMDLDERSNQVRDGSIVKRKSHCTTDSSDVAEKLGQLSDSAAFMEVDSDSDDNDDDDDDDKAHGSSDSAEDADKDTSSSISDTTTSISSTTSSKSIETLFAEISTSLSTEVEESASTTSSAPPAVQADTNEDFASEQDLTTVKVTKALTTKTTLTLTRTHTKFVSLSSVEPAKTSTEMSAQTSVEQYPTAIDEKMVQPAEVNAKYPVPVGQGKTFPNTTVKLYPPVAKVAKLAPLTEAVSVNPSKLSSIFAAFNATATLSVPSGFTTVTTSNSN